MIFNKKDYDSKQRFSIRKLNIGVCSVLLSTLFLTFNVQQVHAADQGSDTNSNTPQTEIKAKQSDASSAATPASDSTAAESKESTALSKNISDSKNTTSAKSSSSTDNKTNSSSASTSNTDNKTNELSAESDKSTVLQKAATQSDLTEKDTTKKANTQDDSAQDDSKNNTVVVSDKKADADASQLLNDSKIQLKKAKAEVPSQDPTPEPLHYEVGTNYIYVVVGTDIKDNPARLFKNGQELLNAGAKFSWVTAVPDITNANYNQDGGFAATIQVTYADGTHKNVDVTLSGEPQVTLQPKTFYYVKNVGDKVDFSQPDSNYNDYDTIIDADGVYSKAEMSYEPTQPIDTSTVGIHWAKIKVTDNGLPDGLTKVVGDPYYVEIPYIVQGLKLRDDIPKDAAGNPIINAQLASQPQGTRHVPTSPISEFNPNIGNTSLLGQYFYQDYALAYALGITTSIDSWTQPTDLINTKSNSFKLVLNYNNGSGAYKLGDSKEQTIDVHYVQAPHIDNIYFYNDGHTYFAGQTANLQIVKKIVDSGMLDKYIYVTLADGTKVYAKTITSIRQLFKGIGGAGTGQFQAGFKATFGGTNSAGQPLIFSSDDLGNVAGAGFNDAVNYWYRKTNDTYDTVNFKALADNSWDRLSTTAYALAPTIGANQGQGVADVTDGPVTFSDDSTGDNSLDVYIENPPTAKELNKYLNSTSAGWNWLPQAAQLNPLPNDNKTWPKGTTFTWIGSDGSKALSFDKAGEIKTGSIKVTLPSGSTTEVKNITVKSRANVKAKSETVDYGTILTADDLVTNKSAFPDGTVFNFANNSEPNWLSSGSLNNVQITATYKDANGKTITTKVTDTAKCVVAINSSRIIKVLKGSSVSMNENTAESILNFPQGWEKQTATWSEDTINTDSNNDEEIITVHYTASGLNQKIVVYVTVIPETTAKEGEQFFTNGNKYDGTAGSIANGTTNQGSILTNAGDNPISYEAYNKTGKPGELSKIISGETSYSPNFSLSGLKTNADGSLVSGIQNVTVHVSVPKGTLGAQVDKTTGNRYYNLSTTIEVAQPVIFKFVDDDDNETIVGTPQTQEFLKGQATTIAPALTIPTNYVLAAGQTLPTSYTLANYSKTNPVVKIHLKHKTKDITDTDTAAHQTRTVTVNYLVANDGTVNGHSYKKGDKVADSAVLDVYYTRTAIKDLVTGKVTYGAWKWDTTKGDTSTPGYHVVSGNWTNLPQESANVVAEIPTVNGFTYDTKGDGTSSIPANEFVSPTYNGTDTTKAGPVAYTADAPNYESKAVHDIWYMPIQTETRTVTAHMKYADAGDLTGQDVYPEEQIKLFFQKTGTRNATTGEVTYGDWTWDTNAGDENTPGFEVISGTDWKNLGSKDQPQTGSWSFVAPNKTGYTTVTAAQDGHYNTQSKGKPNSTGFTNATNTDQYWAYRNDFTVYYVPTSKLSKTVTRTINITEPGQAKTTSTQKVTITRTPYLNLTDTGIVYSDWSNDNWKAQDVPTHDGYTITVNKVVGDQTTPIELVNGQVPAGTVNGTTQDTTINITWSAAAQAKLTGNGSSTYSGKPITLTDLNSGVQVKVTAPTASAAGSYTLQAGDVEFSTDGTTWTTTLPTNADKYQVRLTEQGQNNIKAKYGNNSISWAATAFTSDATYTIKQAAATVKFQGETSKTYDGTAATLPADVKTDTAVKSTDLQGNDTLDLSGLTNDDFDWYQGNTKLDEAPTAVGDYTIKLNDAGLTALKNKNKNYALTLDAAQGYAYHITAAAATVSFSGTHSETYDGKAASLPDDVKTNTAISASGLQNGESLDLDGLTNADFDWYQGSTKLDGAPTAVGDYIIKLNDAGLTALKNKNKNYALTLGTTNSYAFHITAANATVSFQGSHTKTYDGDVATIPDDATTASDITATGLQGNDKLDLSGLSAADFDWYDQTGIHKLTVAPKDAGNYIIKLNAAGLAKLQANKNYNWGAVAGTYTYTIKKATASAALSGSNQMTYSGNAAKTSDINATGGNITVTISIPNGNKTIAYTLQDGDYTWTKNDAPLSSAPSDVGNYTIKLNSAVILSHLQAKIAADATWKGNVDLTDDGLKGSADFTINKATAKAVLSGSGQRTYNGSAVNDNDIQKQDANNNIALKITIPGVADPQTITLTVNDFDWSQGSTKLTSVPSAAGTYNLVLSDNGKKAIAKKFSNNTNIDWEKTITSGSATYTINKATASAALSGHGERNYTGQVISDADIQTQDDDNNIALKVTIPGQTDPAIVTLKVDDFDWSQGTTKLTAVPKDDGTYILTLNAAGKQAIGNQLSSNHNIDWTHIDFTNIGSATYTINKAAAAVNFQGNGSKTYDGSAATIPADAKTTSDITATGLQGNDKLDLSGLTDADFDWYDQTGTNKLTAAPADAGTYTIKLNAAGLAKLQTNNNYNWGNVTGTYIYTINPLTITVKQTGSSSKTYDGQPASIGSDTLSKDIESPDTINGHDLDVSGLNDTDFDWYQGSTNLGTLDKAPADVGTYTIKLNTNGLNKLKKNNKNYSFANVADNYAYTINPAAATFTFQGNGSKTYNGQPASVSVNTLSQDIKSPDTIPGHALDVPELTNAEFDWYDKNGTDLGTLDKAPTNAGTYTIKLNAAGLKALKDQNKNYALTLDSTNSYTYVINKATASAALAGTGERDYNGNAVNNADIQNSHITLTITIPGQAATQTITLAVKDFDWSQGNTPLTSVPTDAGKYTLSLNDTGKDAIKAEFGDNTNIDWNGTTTSGSATYQIKAVAATVTFTGSHSKTYDGKAAILPDDVKTNTAISATHLITGENLDLSGLTANDFDWFDSKNNKLLVAPTDAGTYIIKLNDAGLAALKSKNTNYALTLSTTNNGYTYTIKRAIGTVVFNGNHTEIYTGQANAHPASDFSLTLGVQNKDDYPYHPNYTLKDDDLAFSLDGIHWSTAVPVNVGKYKVRLSDKGWQDLKQFNGNNITWSATSYKDAPNSGDYTITVASASAALTGSNQKTYNGSTVTTADINANGGNIQVTISIPNSNKTVTYTLQDGDYTWAKSDAPLSSAPSDAGKYAINLNKDKILKHLQDQIAADPTWNGNVDLTSASLSGSATFTINRVAITVSQSGTGSVTYNGRPAAMPTTALTNTSNITANGLAPGESLKLDGLSASDFDWFDADGNPLNAAPTDAGNYIIKLNAAGLAQLQDNNKNYSFNAVGGSYSYKINQANATIKLDPTANTQTSVWDGSDIPLNLDNFKPVITTDNPNQPTISLPSGLTLTASDYVITQKGATIAAKEPGQYTVTLTEAGWQKVRDAISGNKNYNWSSTGHGTLTINKASSTITLSGSGSVDYTGSVAQIPYNNGIYKVDLGNDKTYTLQAGDLEFVNSTGNINVGTYYVRLSHAAITHINELAGDDIAHYKYTYDNHNTAILEIKAAAATATLSGHNSRTYNGQAVTIGDINASGGTIKVALSFPGATDDNKYFTLSDGQYTWQTPGNVAPINADSYTLKLNNAGLTALQNYIDSIAGKDNVKLDAKNMTGSATFDITAKDIGIVVTGSASKDYDGNYAAITQADIDSGRVGIKWGDYSEKPTDITFNLSPDDFKVVAENDTPVKNSNYDSSTKITAPIYYIRLTDKAFADLQNQNKNYKFVLDQDNNQATYTIYARKAALTLSGSQTVNYGTDPGQIDLDKFNVDFSNWIGNGKPTITLHKGDLQVITTDNNNYSDGLPINAGKYQVVMTNQLINQLKSTYRNYDFDNIPDVKDASGHVTKPGQDDKHQPASYIVQPLQIGATITGKQSVEYNPSGYTINPKKYHLTFNSVASQDENAFQNDFLLQTGDLEFVTTPGDVGTYQVRLTKDAIKRMKEISGINPANYDWTVLASDLPTANFEVTKKPVTIVTGDKNSSQPQASVYGKPVVIDPNDYSVTVQDENGQPITLNNISFTADDFEFQGSTPNDVGSYQVILSENGINKVENKLGTKNYSFSHKGNGNYKITAAQATVSLTGDQSSTYDADAAQLTNTDGYTLTINTDNGTLDFTFDSSDLQFVDKDGNRLDNPTAAGTYYIALTTDAQNAIKKLGGNDGKNYSFKFGTKPTATYTIKKATAKAVFAGNGSKNYDGSAIVNYTTPIGITITAPGTATTIGLTAGTDYVWTKDGYTYKTAPVDAGTYTIELTNAGKTKIKNVNATNLDWKDTDITGTGTYTIHQVAATVTMDGNQSETYNGHTKPLNLADFVPTIKSGNITMPTIPAGTFTRSDYDVVDSKGNKLSDDQLIKAGTYKVELNASGLNKLKALTGAGNFTWPDKVDTTGTLIIKQASATAALSGNNNRTYNSQSVTINDLNNGGTIAVAITVNGQTITYKLQNGDYSWNTPDGLAPVNASSTAYQINLNKAAILTHLQDKIDQTDPSLKGNYKLTADDLSGTAYFTITKATPVVTFHGEGSKVYDGSAPQPSDYSTPIGLNITNDANAGNNPISLIAGTDYVWVKDGHSYTTPIDVGTYSIELTNVGKNKIHSTTVNGDNLDWSKVDFANVGTGKFTITAATGKAVLDGSNQMTYSGNAATTGNINANGGNIKVTISIPNGNRTITYTLQDGDYTWAEGNTALSSVPSDIGTYTINLNKDKILSHLQAKIATDSTWKGNVNLAANALDGSATFKINPSTITVTQTGSSSKKYDGQAASVDLDTLKNDINAPGTASGQKLDTSGLTDADFDWYKGNTDLGTLDKAQTDAGIYTIKLNSAGLKKLQDQNKNYSFDNVDGSYTYTINKAKATVSMSGTQDSTWSGNPVAIDPSKFTPTIKTNNGLTLNIPAGVHLAADDFEYVNDAGNRIDNPSEVGKYKVHLTETGWQKLESATNNYDWSYDNSEGTVNINKATATITLNGSASVTYTGSVAQIPYKGDHYTVTLSNGQTYTLQDGDLEFVSTGNTDVGNYTIGLSDAGITHIKAVAGNHYNYTYDNSKATLAVTPAEATATLNGSGSHIYDGHAAKFSEGHYTITLSNGMTYTLKDGDYTWAIGSAPTNVGNYKIILTKQGQEHIKALSSNYKWTFAPSNATFDITAQTIGIVINGEASKVWDGNPAKITTDDDLKNITIKWANSSAEPDGINYHFKPSDFVVVDAAGNPVSDVNYNSATGKTTKTYYVRLTAKAIEDIQKSSKNYQFVFDKDNSKATYTIFARKAALTLNGSQTVNYGTDPGQLDPDKFSVDFSNWIGSGKPTITLQKGDLQVITTDNNNYSDGLPINAGSYKVIMTDQLITRLKNDSRFSNYDFTPEEDNPSSGVDDKHQPAVYDVQPLQIGITINGSQSVKYGSTNYNQNSIIEPKNNYGLSFTNIADRDQDAFNGFKLKKGDL